MGAGAEAAASGFLASSRRVGQCWAGCRRQRGCLVVARRGLSLLRFVAHACCQPARLARGMPGPAASRAPTSGGKPRPDAFSRLARRFACGLGASINSERTGLEGTGTHAPFVAPLLSCCRFARGLGAFINLESTGPWGPDVVFQHTGDWTLQVCAGCVPLALEHARGACSAGLRSSWLGSCSRARRVHLPAPSCAALRPGPAQTVPVCRPPHLCAGLRAVGAPPARHHHGPRFFRPG